MPFRRVREYLSTPEKIEPAYPPGVDGMFARLRVELPGHDEAYYADTVERATLTAMASGYTIASVLTAFIEGAKIRGE